MEGYGAAIHFCEPTVAARAAAVRLVVESTGAHVISPSNHPHVIAGQGTCAMELVTQIEAMCSDSEPIACVVVPVGGGGLLAGTALAVKELAPGALVIGAEPEMAGDAVRSLAAGTIQDHSSGQPATIADGLRTILGDVNFPIIRANVDAIVTVPEAAIGAALRTVYERLKLVIEPSSAVAVAACLGGQLAAHGVAAGARVGCILSGGNIDLDRMGEYLALTKGP